MPDVGQALRSGRDRLGDQVRTQLWPLPTVGVLLAVALGVVLPRVDARVDGGLPATVTAFLFGGGASAARAVLEAIAGSLITVTSLTFSLTVVTLQLASSQFSPRLLRTFTRDRFVHLTLALFLATFTYTLTVLRTIRDNTDDGSLFVPQLSVTVAYLLALASVLALVIFLAHLARQIRVETMLRSVHQDASETVRSVFADRSADSSPPSTAALPPELPVAPSGATLLLAQESGFLLQVEEQSLVAVADEVGAVLVIAALPGDSLVAGTPIGAAWPRARESPWSDDVVEQIRRGVADAVHTGFERTAVQDVGYGLRQLTDVASKALSPGINDPTTAVHALGHISALLCELATQELGPRLSHDDQGLVHVALARPDLGDLLEVALDQPRRYGAGDPAVLARLFSLLREVAWTVRGPNQRDAVTAQLGRLRATTAAQDLDATENDRLQALGVLVEHALAGRWPIGETR